MACLVLSTILTWSGYGNTISPVHSRDDDVEHLDTVDTPEDDATHSRYRSIATYKITAYCLRGRTRSGTYTTYGTVATDRRIIPAGTRMEIEGLPGIYTSLDTGSGVLGYHVDVWMDSCVAARQWGVRYRTVYILQ